MGKTGLILIALGAAALSACAPADPAITPAEADVAEGEADAVCAAEDYAYLIGQSRAEAAAANLPEPHRIYNEGDPVTMDYVPRRLNVVIGDGERVTEVRCG